MQHQLGVVLSGGGVKGSAHIGVLKALGAYEVYPTCIAGNAGYFLWSLSRFDAADLLSFLFQAKSYCP